MNGLKNKSKRNKNITEEIIIRPTSGWLQIDLKEIFRFKELLASFTIRDIKIRYKQTFLGVVWAILQPFLKMIVFTLFFGKMAKVPSEEIPYPIFSYSGLLLWQYFSHSITLSGNSLNTSANLIRKIYFPRILIPMGSTIAGILDYLIASVVLIGMMIFYRYPFSFSIFIVPLILVCTLILASGVGFWLSALNVKYKDLRYTLPFIVQMWMFLSPIIYPSSLLGEYKWISIINPMSGFINAHRAAFLHHNPIDYISLSISIGITLLIFFTGIRYFRRMEKTFADLI